MHKFSYTAFVSLPVDLIPMITDERIHSYGKTELIFIEESQNNLDVEYIYCIMTNQATDIASIN